MNGQNLAERLGELKSYNLIFTKHSELTNKRITKARLKKIQKATFSATANKGTVLVKIILPIEKEKVPATIAIRNMGYRSPVMAYAH